MSLSYAEQIEKIKQDVRKAYDGIVKDLTIEANKGLMQTATLIIDNFYNSYNPDYYKRTKNLYKSIIKPKIERAGYENALMASIWISPLFMDNNYKADVDFVEDLIWNQGHRGLPFQELTPKWYPQVSIDGMLLASKSPHLLLSNYVKKWGDKVGKKIINNIDVKYKSNKYISFL